MRERAWLGAGEDRFQQIGIGELLNRSGVEGLELELVLPGIDSQRLLVFFESRAGDIRRQQVLAERKQTRSLDDEVTELTQCRTDEHSGHAAERLSVPGADDEAR